MLALNDPSLMVTAGLAGEFLQTERQSRSVINPATQELIASVQLIDEIDLGNALICAKVEQSAWAGLSGMERGRILRRWGDLMLANDQDLAKLLTAEQGKPYAEALGEIAYAAGYFHWFAGEAERVYGRTLPMAGDKHFPD